MGQIKVIICLIEGLYVIEPAVHGDACGYFMKTYSRHDMEEMGFSLNFVQDNQSAFKKGVLRGLHSRKEFPQGKLVRVIRGRVSDAAVDLRQNSKTFGQWYGVELTEENKKQFHISEGSAHGSLVLPNYAEFCYKATNFYHPDGEGDLAWNDPETDIQWPEFVGTYPGSTDVSGYTLSDGIHLTLSDKDQTWETLKNIHYF